MLSNFTPDEDHLTIRVLPEDADMFRLEVEDDGPGIRAEDIRQLFVEFQQLDNSTAKKYQGTGLGLALTKRIIEVQGGKVGVHSVPGKGSIFFAVLPIFATITGEEQLDASPAERVEPELIAPAALHSVLVIEDDPKDQHWLKKTLLNAGFAVEIAATGPRPSRNVSNATSM